MKILQVNNFHYLRGGSERAYFDTARVLRENGHEVAFFSTKNVKNLPTKWEKYFVDSYDFESELSFSQRIKAVFNIFYNLEAKRKIRGLLTKFKPDVVHLHNIYHHLSPSIIHEIRKQKIPIVMTLHDYKLINPNYSMYVRGRIWDSPEGKKIYQVFTEKAIKNSYLKSLICALEAFLHHGILRIYHDVNLFIAPSIFLQKTFERYGFKGEIKYIPNVFIDNEDDSSLAKQNSQESYVLYFGRLSQEKGVKDLLRAFALFDSSLKLFLVGDGPEREQLEAWVKNKNLTEKIKFLGFQEKSELNKIIDQAEFVVVPSRWYENAPYSILESMSRKKIVLASRIGGIEEMMEHKKSGFLFRFGNVEKLAEKMKYILSLPGDKKRLIEENARKFVLEKHNKDRYTDSLLEVYEELISNNK